MINPSDFQTDGMTNIDRNYEGIYTAQPPIDYALFIETERCFRRPSRYLSTRPLRVNLEMGPNGNDRSFQSDLREPSDMLDQRETY